MIDLKSKVEALNHLILNGNTIQAMEVFYADNVEMQENEEPPRIGKINCINIERNNLQNVKSVTPTLFNQAIDNAKSVVFSEWSFLIIYNDDSKLILTEVSVQHWLNGQVAKEKFYYKSVQKI